MKKPKQNTTTGIHNFLQAAAQAPGCYMWFFYQNKYLFLNKSCYSYIPLNL